MNLNLIPLQQWARRITVILANWWARSWKYRSAFRRWSWLGLVGGLWLSFEGYTRLWRVLTSGLEHGLGITLSERHRLAFCLVLSLIAGQYLMLRVTPLGLSFWSILFWLVHALVMHVFWKQGLRWCRRQLGIRFARSFDPQRPFDALDIGD